VCSEAPSTGARYASIATARSLSSPILPASSCLSSSPNVSASRGSEGVDVNTKSTKT
ncbi:hypothetical protein FIBSPDRAFT_857636, partial [Athelia psychrophila]